MPGVYYFYSAEDVLLYVGKSKQLRARVLNHFSAAKNDSKERKLIKATCSIRYQITCGELSALLLESQEIKRLKPLHNRRLRQHKRLYSWAVSQTTTDQFYQLQLAPSQWPPETGQQLGLYANALQAKLALQKLAHNEGLCPKILGLEKRQGACFAYQLKRCRGACIGAETPASFNQRLLTAFAPQSIAAWPFEGAIMVTEPATKHSKAAHHLINQWYYLGNVDDPENFTAETLQKIETLKKAESLQRNKQDKNKTHEKLSCNLDKDAYRILLSFLLSPENHQLQIRTLVELQHALK